MPTSLLVFFVTLRSILRSRVSGPPDRVQRSLASPYSSFVFRVLSPVPTHLSLAKNSPQPRPIQPVEMRRVVAVPLVGGLHHRYETMSRLSKPPPLLIGPIKQRSRSALRPMRHLIRGSRRAQQTRSLLPTAYASAVRSNFL